MNLSKILVLLTFGLGLFPNLPVVEIIVPIAEAKSVRTVSAYGDTEAQAYAAARSKIPSGYTEEKATFSKAGKRFLCRIRCSKP